MLLEHGLSFEIAFDEDKREAQHKMPPKKMESAENKQTKATGADLQVKQDEAEIRRQQVTKVHEFELVSITLLGTCSPVSYSSLSFLCKGL